MTTLPEPLSMRLIRGPSHRKTGYRQGRTGRHRRGGPRKLIKAETGMEARKVTEKEGEEAH